MSDVLFGFQGVAAINRSGSYTSPVWSVLDLAGDISLDDDSDEVDAGLRSANGVKQTVRSLLSRSATLPIEAEQNVTPGNSLTATSNIAALLGASRQRQAVCDLAFFDPGATVSGGVVTVGNGIRMLAMIKLTDDQPLGDRWLYNFEAKPGRVQAGVEAYAGKPVLDLDYAWAD
jgi:hypothetical protein